MCEDVFQFTSTKVAKKKVSHSWKIHLIHNVIQLGYVCIWWFIGKINSNVFSPVCPFQRLYWPNGESHPEHGPARQRCAGWDPRPVLVLHEDPGDQTIAGSASLHPTGATAPNSDMTRRDHGKSWIRMGVEVEGVPLKQLYMPLPSRITVVTLALAGRAPHFSAGKANESLFTSTVEHSSHFVAWKTGTIFGEEVPSWTKGAPEAEGRRDEGPLLLEECPQTEHRKLDFQLCK